MNTQDDNPETPENSDKDPFPEPRTFPSGWDMSGLASGSQPNESKKRQTRRYVSTALHMKTGLPVDTSACQFPN